MINPNLNPEEYLLMKSMDILARMCDDNPNPYERMYSRIEAKNMVKEIEKYFKEKN